MEDFKVPHEWYEHVATLRMRKHLTTIRGFALNQLLAACAQSSDPKVRQLHASYQVLGDMIGMVTPEASKEEEEDDAAADSR